jgi:Uncharacterised nucleotidyltransferase
MPFLWVGPTPTKLDAAARVRIAERAIGWLRHADLTRVEIETRGWDASQWDAARFAVQVHGIGPLLHARLGADAPVAGSAPRTAGAPLAAGAALAASALDDARPTSDAHPMADARPDEEARHDSPGLPSFLSYLAYCHAMNARRYAVWRAELAGLLFEAGRAGVPLVALKGAALLPFVWPEPALRPTSDIDLLARAADRAALDTACATRGWTFHGEVPRHRTYALARLGLDAKADVGEHPDQPMRLEIHEHAIQMFLGLAHDPTEALWRDALPMRVDAAMVLVPDVAATFEHVLMHTAFDLAKRSTRALKLEDLRLLARQLSREQWDTFVARMQAAGIERFAIAPLIMAERYLEPIAPEPVMHALESRTPASIVAWLRETPLSEFTVCGSAGSIPANAWWRLRWFPSSLERAARARRLLVPTRAERLAEFVAVGQTPSLWAYYRAQVSRWRRDA